MKISGDLEDSFKVEWQDIANEDVSRSWNDEQELTEYAAVGIALPLILQLTSYTTFKRARKGDGMDYWLGREDKNGLPILEALLEVSGIFKENESNTVESRVGLKKKQLKKSAYKSLPGYVVVVEFGVPKSKFVSI